MIFKLYNATSNSKLKFPSENGKQNGCPFCTARLDKQLASNEAIAILAGMSAGKVFEVVEKASYANDWHCREKIAFPDGLWTISSQRDLYLKLPVPEVPSWMPSLSVEDCCMIDDVLMRIVSNHNNFGNKQFDLTYLSHLISFCWIHRIPVDPTELCNFLEAHGHPHKMRQETITALQRGIYLLTFANGKPAIKRRKMKAFEFFRYQPKIQSKILQDFHFQLYGRQVKYSDLNLMKIQ